MTPLLTAMALFAVLSCCAWTQVPRGEQGSEFGGTWVLRIDRQSIFKLTLSTGHGLITGTLTRPRKLEFDQDGDVTQIGPDQVTLPVRGSKLDAGRLELFIDDDRFVMTPVDRGHALLALEGMRPWKLERAPDPGAVILATSLPEPDYPEEIRTLRERLRAMVKEDQDARRAFDESRTEAVDARNRPEVLRIFSKYGWLRNSVVGKSAANDFWLLVQHQTLEIQQRLLPALAKTAESGEASMSHYAYLYDRVQVRLGKPQRWGTHINCEDGQPVLAPVDDPAGLDARRKELFMPPIGEYLKNDYFAQLCGRAGK